MAYVYLIVEEPFADESTKDLVKIGYTQNPPEWRMSHNLKMGNPRTIRVAAAFVYETNSAAWNAEKAAHIEFKEYLCQKEWFHIHWREVERWFLRQGARLRDESMQPA